MSNEKKEPTLDDYARQELLYRALFVLLEQNGGEIRFNGADIRKQSMAGLYVHFEGEADTLVIKSLNAEEFALYNELGNTPNTH